MSSIAGIDLGTTFSGLAVLNSIGQPEIVPDADGARITPSALFFEHDGAIVVGTTAIRSVGEDKERSVRWIKRHMGEAEYPRKILGKPWTPAELSSLILKKLRQDCSMQKGEITDAVITVPAYFDEFRRKATMDAGKMAGLNVAGIVNEPTAAALYYAMTHQVSGRIMVFDLGGGTFDVTVMDVSGQDINIVCSKGAHELGGVDFDMCVAGLFDDAYKAAHGCSLYPTENDRDRCLLDAEDVKKTLTSRPKAKKLLRGPSGDVPFELSREDFEEAISPLIAQIEMLIEDVLDEANNDPTEIDKVLLVGGSSRMPVVKSRLTKIFGFEPTTAVNVDESVALGAALYAGLRLVKEGSGKISTAQTSGLGDARLTDVCNHSYGTIIMTADEDLQRDVLVNDIILKKNTPLPCEKTQRYQTRADGQTKLAARVTQGESKDPDFVNILKKDELVLPPNRPAGRPITITYSYDEDQRMHCVFHDEESGRELIMDINSPDGSAQAPIEESRAKVEQFTVE